MLNTTVTTRFPGVTMRLTRSAIVLRTVTVTVLQEPAALSEPDGGDTVTLPLRLVIRKLTGPPTALTIKLPLTGLPASADSTSCLGVTCSVPGVGGGDDEGEGDEEGDLDGDLDGDGEDRDQLTVLHGPNRSSPPPGGETQSHNQKDKKTVTG
jgi:hypothetical protein